MPSEVTNDEAQRLPDDASTNGGHNMISLIDRQKRKLSDEVQRRNHEDKEAGEKKGRRGSAPDALEKRLKMSGEYLKA